jgi:hypothetical protein
MSSTIPDFSSKVDINTNIGTATRVKLFIVDQKAWKTRSSELQPRIINPNSMAVNSREKETGTPAKRRASIKMNIRKGVKFMVAMHGTSSGF